MSNKNIQCFHLALPNYRAASYMYEYAKVCVRVNTPWCTSVVVRVYESFDLHILQPYSFSYTNQFNFENFRTRQFWSAIHS